MSVSAKAVCVDPKKVDLIWPDVAHWIRRAMKRADLGDFASVEHDVLEGNALLWLALIWPGIEGAAVTQIGLTERSKVCTVIACGGKGARHWVSLIARIEEYAKEQGCDCVRIFGRKGWMRWLPEYSAPQVILERRL